MDKVICIGKNYLEHAKELNKLIGDAIPNKPVIFFKPPSVVKQVKGSQKLQAELPKELGEVHHECEIALRVSRDCYKVSPEEAKKCFDAVTLGLDMTLRDLQAQLKKNGHPWEMGKVFKDAILLGQWVELSDFEDYLESDFELKINGQTKQKSNGTKMSLSPQECLSYASQYFEIKNGDILFTGTPEGVGPVKKGDLATVSWSNKLSFAVQW